MLCHSISLKSERRKKESLFKQPWQLQFPTPLISTACSLPCHRVQKYHLNSSGHQRTLKAVEKCRQVSPAAGQSVRRCQMEQGQQIEGRSQLRAIGTIVTKGMGTHRQEREREGVAAPWYSKTPAALLRPNDEQGETSLRWSTQLSSWLFFLHIYMKIWISQKLTMSQLHVIEPKLLSEKICWRYHYLSKHWNDLQLNWVFNATKISTQTQYKTCLGMIKKKKRKRLFTYIQMWKWSCGTENLFIFNILTHWHITTSLPLNHS